MPLEARPKDFEHQADEEAISAKKRLTFGSLFAGIGGFRSWIRARRDEMQVAS